MYWDGLLCGRTRIVAFVLLTTLLAVSTTAASASAQQVAPPAGGMMQGPAGGPAGELRSQLNQLLSEHTVLAGIATEKAVMGAPDLRAAVDHLDQNSVLLSQFIGSLYGADAANQFLPTWRTHTRLYLAYARATCRGNQAMRMRARDALNQWVQTQAAQFAALNPALPADMVATQLQTHVDGTLAAIDTYAQGNFERHYDIMHQAVDHSFMMSDMMATAIAQQFPDRFALQR